MRQLSWDLHNIDVTDERMCEHDLLFRGRPLIEQERCMWERTSKEMFKLIEPPLSPPHDLMKVTLLPYFAMLTRDEVSRWCDNWTKGAAAWPDEIVDIGKERGALTPVRTEWNEYVEKRLPRFMQQVHHANYDDVLMSTLKTLS